MRARNWLIVNAAYFGLLGIGYLVAPGTFLAIFYLPEAGEVAPYVARLAGGLGVGLFVLIWGIRRTGDLTTFRLAYSVLLFLDIATLWGTIAGLLAGDGPPASWVPAGAIIFALGAGSASFLFRTSANTLRA